MEPSDSELVLRARAGKTAAFARLVERHHRACLRFALRMLGTRQDAEEAVQDAFLRAYRSLDRYEDRNRFRAWLFRILVNRCRTAASRRSRQERLFEPLEGDPGLAAEPEPVDGRWSAEVQRALMQLRPALREALLLRCVEEQSYEEIAAAAGCGVSAAKMRVKRARDRLRGLLQETYNA